MIRAYRFNVDRSSFAVSCQSFVAAHTGQECDEPSVVVVSVDVENFLALHAHYTEERLVSINMVIREVTDKHTQTRHTQSGL